MAATPYLQPIQIAKPEPLAFIRAYIRRTGHNPSIIDIARVLGVSTVRAKALVEQLVDDGTIERVPS